MIDTNTIGDIYKAIRQQTELICKYRKDIKYQNDKLSNATLIKLDKILKNITICLDAFTAANIARHENISLRLLKIEQQLIYMREK